MSKMTTIVNTDRNPKQVVLVTRELIELAPGEKIEFDGDIELVNNTSPSEYVEEVLVEA
jgi:hypothetical protein